MSIRRRSAPKWNEIERLCADSRRRGSSRPRPGIDGSKRARIAEDDAVKEKDRSSAW